MFAFVGAKFKRPLLIGLIFIFGWEQAALAFPGYLKQFTVAVLPPGPGPARDAERRRHQPDPGHLPGEPGAHGGSLFWLGVIWSVFLAWGAWTVERQEYVLEQ